jgi:two-component system sensor histidine kinase DesK
VARTALHEVREAVAGYRQPTLADELHAAAEILAAAGIAYSCDGAPRALSPAAEAVLSWAIREGVTNVIKHSRARRCIISFTGDEEYVGVELRDDGRGASSPLDGGSGLRGLRERVAARGGRCEAGPLPEGGFRLSVSLPLDGSSDDADVTVERAGKDLRDMELS